MVSTEYVIYISYRSPYNYPVLSSVVGNLMLIRTSQEPALQLLGASFQGPID